MEKTELFDVPEAASFLHVKEPTIRKWRFERKLPFCKIGRVIRFRKSDLEKIIQQSLQAAKE